MLPSSCSRWQALPQVLLLVEFSPEYALFDVCFASLRPWWHRLNTKHMILCDWHEVHVSRRSSVSAAAPKHSRWLPSACGDTHREHHGTSCTFSTAVMYRVYTLQLKRCVGYVPVSPYIALPTIIVLYTRNTSLVLLWRKASPIRLGFSSSQP